MAIIVILPMWVNFILRIMAWQLLLSRNGLINGALGAIGLPGQDLANSSMAIVIGMVYDYLPFMILPVYNAAPAGKTGKRVLPCAEAQARFDK